MTDKRKQEGANRPQLRLHVPEPRFRPGDQADFSYLNIPAAGAQFRPDESCAASETNPLCTDLIRVLGDDNQAHGPWNPRLSPDTMRQILRAGVYELIARPDVPTSTVINEYLDVAHAFFDEREAKFVNALLDAVAKEKRG